MNTVAVLILLNKCNVYKTVEDKLMINEGDGMKVFFSVSISLLILMKWDKKLFWGQVKKRFNLTCLFMLSCEAVFFSCGMEPFCGLNEKQGAGLLM